MTIPTITRERLQTILSGFGQLTIGLVGDLFLDRYLEIEPGFHELSRETGLEAYQVLHVRNSPGALGTLINNLAALGVGRIVPVTVIGDDGHGYDLRRSLKELPVDTSYILSDPQRLTPTYTKPLKQTAQSGWQELNRLDVCSHQPLSYSTCQLLSEHLRSVFQATQGLIVLDQVCEEDGGVVNRQIRNLLFEMAQEQNDKLIFIDSRAHLGEFSFGILKGNRQEVTASAGLVPDDRGVRLAVERICTRTGKPVFCTLGEQGILVARPGAVIDLVASYPVLGPVDIVGAGDSATSGIVASLLSGANEIEAAAVGNLVASITVQQLGTTGTAVPSQVVQRWSEMS